MSRPIEFRGKRIDNGEWVYGSLLQYPGNLPAIFSCTEPGASMSRPVDPETVGQYTGLDDKKGKKAFGGDNIKDGRGVTYEIKWYDDLACFMCESYKTDEYLYSVSDFEIIGTIHDEAER